jgi:hypothetical protein
MLGRGYPGYFPLFDDRALARQIERCRLDASFYVRLQEAVSRRRGIFAPAAERAALGRALGAAMTRSFQKKRQAK